MSLTMGSDWIMSPIYSCEAGLAQDNFISIFPTVCSQDESAPFKPVCLMPAPKSTCSSPWQRLVVNPWTPIYSQLTACHFSAHQAPALQIVSSSRWWSIDCLISDLGMLDHWYLAQHHGRRTLAIWFDTDLSMSHVACPTFTEVACIHPAIVWKFLIPHKSVHALSWKQNLLPTSPVVSIPCHLLASQVIQASVLVLSSVLHFLAAGQAAADQSTEGRHRRRI